MSRTLVAGGSTGLPDKSGTYEARNAHDHIHGARRVVNPLSGAHLL